jgi:hypothetical protein
MRAELDALICSVPRIGKQHTNSLLDERAPNAAKLSREESLAKLANKYFTVHGPAAIADFVWWSGLTVKDAKTGIEMVKDDFETVTIKGKDYIFKDSAFHKISSNQAATFLMPDYDEYAIGYKDRSAIFGKMNINLNDLRIEQIANHVIIIDGIAQGTWRRIVRRNNTAIETTLSKLNNIKCKAAKKAVENYCRFTNKS